jgi:pimeloyl-ACP methyl ester carboxylesterase
MTKSMDTRQYFFRSLCLLVMLAYGRVVLMHGQSPSVAAQSDAATKAPADIADTIPGAELVIIPNVGHVPHLQVPGIFNRELLKFLAP